MKLNLTSVYDMPLSRIQSVWFWLLFFFNLCYICFHVNTLMRWLIRFFALPIDID